MAWSRAILYGPEMAEQYTTTGSKQDILRRPCWIGKFLPLTVATASVAPLLTYKIDLLKRSE